MVTVNITNRVCKRAELGCTRAYLGP